MNPEKIYVEVPGELGWREYKLRELVWLWRTGQLPHHAVFQNDCGEWRPIDELVDPIIEREDRAAAATGNKVPAAGASGRSQGRGRYWVVAGLSIILFGVVVCAWSVARGRYLAWEVKQREERELLEWERRARIDDFIKSEDVVPGMTLEEVRRSWGEPRTKKATADGAQQQWIYRQQTVNFEHGVVTGLEATQPQRK